MLSRSSGGTAAADRQLSANLGSIGSARGSPEEAPGLMASGLDRLQMAQVRVHTAGATRCEKLPTPSRRQIMARHALTVQNIRFVLNPLGPFNMVQILASQIRTHRLTGHNAAACRGFSSSGSRRAWASCTRSSCKTRSTWCAPHLLCNSRWSCPVCQLMRRV